MKKFTMILASLALAVSLHATTVTNIPNLLGDIGSGATQAAQDGYNAISSFNFKQGVDGGVFGLKNGKNYGAGVLLIDAATNNPVHLFFSLATMQEVNSTTGKKQWGFYDGSGGLSVQQTETVPVINVPMTLRVWSGPAFKIAGNGSGGILEQSGISGDFDFRLSTHAVLTVGGGLLHCSDSAIGTAKLIHVNLAWTF